MNERDPSHRRESGRPVRARLIFAFASLCFSLWVSIAHPKQGDFFIRYGLVSLGIASIVGMFIVLKQPRKAARLWLWVLWGIAFAISFVGIIELYR